MLDITSGCPSSPVRASRALEKVTSECGARRREGRGGEGRSGQRRVRVTEGGRDIVCVKSGVSGSGVLICRAKIASFRWLLLDLI